MSAAAYTPEPWKIDAAQAALNFHPDASPFWDGQEGQDILSVVSQRGLKPQNTNRERCALYAAAKVAA